MEVEIWTKFEGQHEIVLKENLHRLESKFQRQVFEMKVERGTYQIIKLSNYQIIKSKVDKKAERVHRLVCTFQKQVLRMLKMKI